MGCVTWSFVGSLPASKSLMLRALIAQSFYPHFEIIGTSNCDDVQKMRQALCAFEDNQPIDCGHAAAILRFLALRVARRPGHHILKGSERLMSRPHDVLLSILRQMGVQADFSSEGLKIHSQGWRPMGDALQINGSYSSQFTSAVLLNSWELDFPLFISIGHRRVSDGYWIMTKNLLTQLGMRIEVSEDGLYVPAGQRLTASQYKVEPDMSSAFALSAVAAVSGAAVLTDFPEVSLQPDFGFLVILSAMGVPLDHESQILKVDKAASMQGKSFDLSSCPDLFPSLAVLCALAEGESALCKASHLAFKESNRLTKVAELLRVTGRNYDLLPDGLRIDRTWRVGPQVAKSQDIFTFDPDQDHRLAMAAAILVKAGWPVHILNPGVVSKSFPEFWQYIGWSS